MATLCVITKAHRHPESPCLGEKLNKRACPRHTLGPRLTPYTALADTAMGVARHVCVQSVGQEDGEGVHLQQGLRRQELFGLSKTSLSEAVSHPRPLRSWLRKAPVSAPRKGESGILGPEAGSLGAWWAQMAPLGTVRRALPWLLMAGAKGLLRGQR